MSLDSNNPRSLDSGRDLLRNADVQGGEAGSIIPYLPLTTDWGSNNTTNTSFTNYVATAQRPQTDSSYFISGPDYKLVSMVHLSNDTPGETTSWQANGGNITDSESTIDVIQGTDDPRQFSVADYDETVNNELRGSLKVTGGTGTIRSNPVMFVGIQL